MSGRTGPPASDTADAAADTTYLPQLNARQLDFMNWRPFSSCTLVFLPLGILQPNIRQLEPNIPRLSNHNYRSQQPDRRILPRLNPDVFNPTDLDVEDWMAASAAMGMKEICLTAHHEGGFALWPSFTNYRQRLAGGPAKVTCCGTLLTLQQVGHSHLLLSQCTK